MLLLLINNDGAGGAACWKGMLLTNLTKDELRCGEAKARDAGEYSTAISRFIAEQPGDLFVTLAINSGALPMRMMTYLLSQYLAKLDRRFTHNHFYRLPPERRTDGVFIAEKIDCNAHWHGIMRFPPEKRKNAVVLGLTIEDAVKIWKKVAPAGDAQFLTMMEGRKAVAAYVSKESWKRDFLDQMAFAADFHAGKKAKAIMSDAGPFSNDGA